MYLYERFVNISTLIDRVLIPRAMVRVAKAQGA